MQTASTASSRRLQAVCTLTWHHSYAPPVLTVQYMAVMKQLGMYDGTESVVRLRREIQGFLSPQKA